MEGNLHRIAIKIGTGIRPLRQADGIEPLPGAVLKRSDDQVTVAAQIRIQKIQAAIQKYYPNGLPAGLEE